MPREGAAIMAGRVVASMADEHTLPDAPSAVRSAGLVGASLVAWALGSYAYYLIAGRVVGPATYGLVSALIAIISIVAWPCVALQWSSARTLASTTAAGRADAMAAYRLALRRSIAVGVALGVAGLVGTGLATLVSDRVPVAALAATFVSVMPILALYVAIGALQGEHRYGAYGVSWALTGVLRAPLMLPFFLLPAAGAGSVVIGTGLAMAVGLGAAVWASRDDLRVRMRPSPEMWAAFKAGMFATVLGLLGYAAIVGVLAVIAKLRLPAVEAGYFGAAYVIGRALLIVPQAFAIVLLPRVARRRAGDTPTGALLAAGVLATVAFGAFCVVVSAVAGEWIMRISFGTEYLDAAPLLPGLFAATTAVGALFILVNHHVARSDPRFSWVLAVLAVVDIAALAAFGSTEALLITIDGAVAVLGIVVHEIVYRGSDDGLIGGTRAFLRAVRSSRA